MDLVYDNVQITDNIKIELIKHIIEGKVEVVGDI